MRVPVTMMSKAYLCREAEHASRAAGLRAQALDANGAVPCTCADIRHAAYRMGEVPPAQLLGWHYDACQRTIAALKETVQ